MFRQAQVMPILPSLAVMVQARESSVYHNGPAGFAFDASGNIYVADQAITASRNSIFR